MDLKEIKLIIDLMKRSELTEFEIEEEHFKLRIRRETGSNGNRSYGSPPSYTFEHSAMHAPAPAAPMHATPISIPAPTAPKGDDANTVIIKSPMVGTYYRSPSPESSVFVNVGSSVREETVVCIIEAMKVMNEIHAETSGTVVEILVENGQSVEYGQPLFKVRKS